MTTATVSILPRRPSGFRARLVVDRGFGLNAVVITGYWNNPKEAFYAALMEAETKFGLDCSNYRPRESPTGTHPRN
jgi:hypothetical protein